MGETDWKIEGSTPVLPLGCDDEGEDVQLVVYERTAGRWHVEGPGIAAPLTSKTSAEARVEGVAVAARTFTRYIDAMYRVLA
jgi:hypothetical protein